MTTTDSLVARIEPARAFQLGDRVRKVKGSSWHGRIVGLYSTGLTPIGYAVESEREPGSVQIYPEAALAREDPAEIASIAGRIDAILQACPVCNGRVSSWAVEEIVALVREAASGGGAG